MKISALVQELNNLLKEVGDLPLHVLDDNDDEAPLAGIAVCYDDEGDGKAISILLCDDRTLDAFMGDQEMFEGNH